jgi:hypothetical protein
MICSWVEFIFLHLYIRENYTDPPLFIKNKKIIDCLLQVDSGQVGLYCICNYACVSNILRSLQPQLWVSRRLKILKNKGKTEDNVRSITLTGKENNEQERLRKSPLPATLNIYLAQCCRKNFVAH